MAFNYWSDTEIYIVKFLFPWGLSSFLTPRVELFQIPSPTAPWSDSSREGRAVPSASGGRSSPSQLSWCSILRCLAILSQPQPLDAKRKVPNLYHRDWSGSCAWPVNLCAEDATDRKAGLLWHPDRQTNTLSETGFPTTGTIAAYPAGWDSLQHIWVETTQITENNRNHFWLSTTSD